MSPVCEQHPPVGNLRKDSFPVIWNSEKAVSLRKSIACKECFCTNEVLPLAQPGVPADPARQGVRRFRGAWRQAKPLSEADPRALRRGGAAGDGADARRCRAGGHPYEVGFQAP